MAETHHLSEERAFLTYKDGEKTTVRHHIVKEVPLTIMLNGQKLATLVCSPHSFEVLAVGFLVNEGFLHRPDQLGNITCQPDQRIVWVDMADSAERAAGLQGERSADDCGKHRSPIDYLTDREQMQPAQHGAQFAVNELLGYVALLEEKADTFRLTGGVHEAALAHGGTFVIRYEDIGRHNALDRILGYAFLNAIDTSDKAVILSGRIASEMLIKSAHIGVPMVVSRSAPTSLSIEMAEQLGITLVGFARGTSLNVYTHPYRVTDGMS